MSDFENSSTKKIDYENKSRNKRLKTLGIIKDMNLSHLSYGKIGVTF